MSYFKTLLSEILMKFRRRIPVKKTFYLYFFTNISTFCYKYLNEFKSVSNESSKCILLKVTFL